MLMVIFGAGASYDSVYRGDLARGSDANFRPPLAAELFGNRPNFGRAIMSLPAARPLIARMRDTVGRGRDIEETLEEVQELAEQDHPQLFRQLMALKVYLQEILDECSNRWLQASNGLTNYTRLLDRIELWRRPADERVLLLTFNYDWILESACNDAFDLNPASITDYTRREDYKLIHLHGSTRWGRVTNSARKGTPRHRGAFHDRLPRDLVANAERVRLSDDYVISRGEREGFAIAPAVAIPFRTKQAFECPRQHLDALKASLPKVDRLLIVGWRAREMHFLALCTELMNLDVEGLVVSGDQAGAEDVVAFLSEKAGFSRLHASGAQGFSSLAREEQPLESLLEGRL
jgi:hypothetical protein